MQIDCAIPVAGTARAPTDVQDVSDATLIRLIASGDQKALQLLFGRHNLKTFRFIRGLVQDAPLAEDLLAEVFFDVWRQADKFQSGDRPSTWLLAIARNKAITALRRRSGDPSNNGCVELRQARTDDLDLTILKKQRISLLFLCLMQLSDEHREIVDLVYYHRQSIDEVAQILDIPRNTVKARMLCARQWMEHLFAKVGVESTSLN